MTSENQGCVINSCNCRHMLNKHDIHSACHSIKIERTIHLLRFLFVCASSSRFCCTVPWSPRALALKGAEQRRVEHFSKFKKGKAYLVRSADCLGAAGAAGAFGALGLGVGAFGRAAKLDNSASARTCEEIHTFELMEQVILETPTNGQYIRSNSGGTCETGSD